MKKKETPCSSRIFVCSGFTLLEVMITLAFLSIICVPLATLIVVQDRDLGFRSAERAGMLRAQSLMEEMGNKAFEDPHELPAPLPSAFRSTEEITSNRTIWNDIDDYDGYVETATHYTLSISVNYVSNVNDPLVPRSLLPLVTSDTKCVTLYVVVPQSTPMKLTRLFFNFYNTKI